MSGLINSAMSGLSAAQSALMITSLNISNYTVAGYNRQTLLLSQAGSRFSGNAWYGNGVNVNGVQRQYDELITRQLMEASAKNSAAGSQFAQISGIDNMLTMDGNDLSDALQEFFKNVQSVVDNADDPAARQALLSNAKSLAGQIRTFQQYLDNQQKSVNNQITDSVNTINSYTSQIAALNEQIAKLSASGQAPNNLLDQRDQLVSELNNITAVNVSMQDNTMVISLPNGVTLVNGNQTTQMKAVPSAENPGRLIPGYTDKLAGDIGLPDKMFTSGSLSGLLAFRRDDLDAVQNRLGQITVAFASEMNKVQHQGYDGNGDPGTDFFTLGEPEVWRNNKNTSDTTMDVAYEDSSALKASDYRVTWEQGHWTVTRLSDNQVLTPEVSESDGKTHLSIDGLDITVNGNPEEKDSFLVRPLAGAARGFDVALTDGEQIAAAAEPGGASDNRNAQAMLDLQDSAIVGGATLTQAYGSLVSFVGNETSRLQERCETEQKVVDQLTGRQQSVSGVNLDEEYSLLTQYQQYYIANTKVLQTAGTLFDAIINISN